MTLPHSSMSQAADHTGGFQVFTDVNKAPTHLTHLFNHLLRLGYFPTNGKRAKVIPIPKPNKPGTDPNSYRPISLLSTLGKLFERILAARLTSFVNRQHLLPHTQFGFRKKTFHCFPIGSIHRLHLQRL